MDRLRFAPLALTLLVFGCGGSDSSDSVSVASRSENGICPSQLKTGAGAGASCSVSGDCGEVCCRCSGGGKSFAAAACVNALCASTAVTCQKAEENRPGNCQ